MINENTPSPCTGDSCPIDFDDMSGFVMTDEMRDELSNNRGEDEGNE